MAQLDDIIQKIPRPVLVLGILIVALIVIVQQKPMSDGCEVEVENFTRNVRGIMVGYKDSKGRIQYPQLEFLRDRCVEGNSQGTCEEYFKNLKRVADSLVVISEKCYPKLKEEYTKLVPALVSGVKIMALVAWGEAPPQSISERLGWLTEGDIYGFCRSKNMLIKLTSSEDYLSVRKSTYREFPDHWPENIPTDKKAELPRPRALKSADNIMGSLDESEVYARSLFSLRCDLYQ